MPVEYLYFVEDGLVSVQAAADEQESVEVWLIGREGAVGSLAALGFGTSPLRHVVHMEGHAYRISVDDMVCLIKTMPQLSSVLLGYVHVALMQSSQIAACSLRHSFPQRLARWLLTAQDRTARHELPITQDSLARALGVRRATVSETMKSLERKGLITRVRGLVRIRDRSRLEQTACHCYRVLRREQERPRRWPIDQVFALQAVCCLV